jgi:hypothetical protein
MSHKALSSGELAALLGVALSTIHYQCKTGILTEPKTTPGGHRRFDPRRVVRDYKVAGRKVPRALATIAARVKAARGAEP